MKLSTSLLKKSFLEFSFLEWKLTFLILECCEFFLKRPELSLAGLEAAEQHFHDGAAAAYGISGAHLALEDDGIGKFSAAVRRHSLQHCGNPFSSEQPPRVVEILRRFVGGKVGGEEAPPRAEALLTPAGVARCHGAEGLRGGGDGGGGGGRERWLAGTSVFVLTAHFFF